MYKGILFDSDTDQKVNLIDTYSNLKEDETIIWLGKNNEPLECKREDLNNIGNLIRSMTTFVWGKNAVIKEMIKNANTIEELNNIVIDYEIELSNTDTKPVGIDTPEGIIFDNLNKVPKIGE